MLPNNNDTMYRIARMRAKEIHDDVESARDDQIREHILRRRIVVLAGAALIGLVLAVTILALTGWTL
jgi:hypothetical protein